MKTKVIFGPPGTGKTTKLLSILEEELKTYSKDEIAFVSYTKEGVNQGKKRAIEKFGGKLDEYPYFRTLHSLAFYALGAKPVDMITKKHYKEFSKKMGMYFTGYYTEDLKHNDDKYLFINDLHRNNPRLVKNYIDTVDIKKYNFVKNNYKRFKDHFGIRDYTDLIEGFIDIGKGTPVKVVIIDEAQDLTTLQWKMIWTAFKHVDKMYVAGDDDQAIYQWSGADVEYFLDMEGDIEILKQSYRLPSSVLDLSKKVSSMISKRVVKDYKSTGKEGDVIWINNLEELNINNDESWLFLSRNNIFLKDIGTFLANKGIPYRVKGSPTIKEADLNMITKYEEIRKTRLMSKDEERKLKPHLNEMYSLNEAWYDSFNWDIDKKMHIRDFIKNKFQLKDWNVLVNTIHSTKGSEADNVVLLMDITGNVNKNLNSNPDSEHRVFYVGMTRARKKLYLVHGKSKYSYKIYK